MSKVKTDCINYKCGKCRGMRDMECAKNEHCPFYKSNREYHDDGKPRTESKSEVEQWLDAQVAWRDQGKKLQTFNSDIRVIDANYMDGIHCNNAALLAEMLGVKLYITEHSENLEYHNFWYKGYKVYSLEDKQ